MGYFYTKIILKGLSKQSLIDYLNLIRRETYVSPTMENDFTIVYDQKLEDSSKELFNFTCQLSRKFTCPALAILVHDDQILHYELNEAGKMKDEYVSNVGFHNPEAGDYPEGGNAQKLCSILGANNASSKVRFILHTPSSLTDYSNASSRLTKLVKALGISSFWAADCVGGYQDVERESITPATKKAPSPELALSLMIKTGQNN